MKKLLALVLALVMLCSLLAACGGSSEPAAASSAPSNAPSSAQSSAAPAANDQDDDDDYDDDEEAGSDDTAAEYEAIMSDFIGNFEDLMGSLGELLALSDEIASEDDLYVWCEEFDNIKAIAGAAADELANVAEHVPEEYQESHVKITIAVAAIYDAMTGFEGAVVGAISGDADAFETGLGEFVGNIVAADALWQEAVEY